MKLSDAQIKEIAEELDIGMICYIHKETKELKFVIDMNDPYADAECWEEELEEIESNFDKYVKIEKMPSRDSFEMMVDFVEEVSNKRIRARMVNALERRKPFANFRQVVDSNETVRQQWFKFRDDTYQEWVRKQLADILESEEDEEVEEISPIVNGFFDDDGNEINPNLHPLPNLCLSCKKRNDPDEEMVCNLTRLDQVGEQEFKCFAYEKLG